MALLAQRAVQGLEQPAEHQPPPSAVLEEAPLPLREKQDRGDRCMILIHASYCTWLPGPLEG